MFRKLTLLGTLTALVAANAPAQDKADHVAIIVNKSSGLDNVTLSDLQKYLKAEKTKDPSGSKVVLTQREPGPERDAVLREVYKMSDGELSRYFLQATFTGAVAAAPKQIGPSAVNKKFVADTAGAIGFVRASEADNSVKVLKVDGKAPGEAGYPIVIPK
ncbi:MAG: hypothetical protein HY043_10395 [Verrucomicrobia bacterium]|nr:hypothetical protein [Verrucomicrobiota bacterium]